MRACVGAVPPVVWLVRTGSCPVGRPVARVCASACTSMTIDRSQLTEEDGFFRTPRVSAKLGERTRDVRSGPRCGHNPGTPKISADLVRALLRSRGKISGATLTCAAAALLGCPEATDDETVHFYMFLIKRLEQIATDDECRANVQKIVRYPG